MLSEALTTVRIVRSGQLNFNSLPEYRIEKLVRSKFGSVVIIIFVETLLPMITGKFASEASSIVFGPYVIFIIKLKSNFSSNCTFKLSIELLTMIWSSSWWTKANKEFLMHSSPIWHLFFNFL